MILVDTSVIIDYARGKDAALVALLPTLAVAVNGIVRAELLCGARDPSHRSNLVTMLGAFTHIPLLDHLWDTVGDNLALLRSKGQTVPFPDIVLATQALEMDIELWTRDVHFSSIQIVLGHLKLFTEPP